MRLFSLLISMLWLIGPACAGDLPTELPTDLDAHIERALKTFQVPGVSVAIVKDGKTVMARGYGVRDIDKPELVDGDTLFGIASNTKAFTGASLAILVDDGLLEWDDPVINYLPDFRMYNSYITSELTVRDLLVHRSGFSLGAGDLLHWPEAEYTTEEIIYRLRFIKPATSFRAKYAYDNVLYLVAGQVVAKVSGMPWKDFVKQRIFTPLGMNRASFTAEDFLADSNHVAPHIVLEDRLQTVRLMGLDSIAPAGAINASAAEMALWVTTQLNQGRIGDSDKRIFSEAQSREMHSIVTPYPVGKLPPAMAAQQANFRGYGLGWAVQDYQGKKMVAHNGGLLGQVSRVTMLPDLSLGVVVLTNQQSGAAFSAITYLILDHYLGLEKPTDWITVYADQVAKNKAGVSELLKKQEAEHNTNSKPSLALSAYAGLYRDSWFGDATITLEGEALRLRFVKSPLMIGTMEHYQYDTFIVRWDERSLEADAYVSFALEADGSVEKMKMKPVSPMTDFSFNFQDLHFVPVSN